MKRSVAALPPNFLGSGLRDCRGGIVVPGAKLHAPLEAGRGGRVTRAWVKGNQFAYSLSKNSL